MDEDTKIETRLIWVYNTINFTNGNELEEWALQSYGYEGWELVQVVVFGGMGYPAGVIIFKRQERVAV